MDWFVGFLVLGGFFFSPFPANYMARKPIAIERGFCYLRLLSVVSAILRGSRDRDTGCAV